LTTSPSLVSTHHGLLSWVSPRSDLRSTRIWVSAPGSSSKGGADFQDGPIIKVLQSHAVGGMRQPRTSRPGMSMLEPSSPLNGMSGTGDIEVSTLSSVLAGTDRKVPSWSTWPHVHRLDVTVSMLQVYTGSRSPKLAGMARSSHPRPSPAPRLGLSISPPKSRLGKISILPVFVSADFQSLPYPTRDYCHARPR